MNGPWTVLALSLLGLTACGSPPGAGAAEDSREWMCVVGCATVDRQTGDTGTLYGVSTASGGERAPCGLACGQAREHVVEAAGGGQVALTACEYRTCFVASASPGG